MTALRTASVFLGTSVLGLCASACSVAPDAAAAAAAAESFHAAVRASDGATACELLAPETVKELEESAGATCTEAIQAAELPVAGDALDTAAYVRSARVELNGDVVFVSDFDGEWQVTAAGCSLRPDDSYDCAVRGG